MKTVTDHFQSPVAYPFVSESDFNESSFLAVKRDPDSWACAMPLSQGLYDNDLEKDACGVGFICHIKGVASHKLITDARQLLCAMTHRGATGADSRDGDGAGVMTGLPHAFFQRETTIDLGCTIPGPGEYAVGNFFFKANDPVSLQSCQSVFSKLAGDLGLRVLGWREVPTDGTILGPAASSKEPLILQPFVVLRSNYGDGTVSENGPFDELHFNRQLYVLRKQATHTMSVSFSFFSTNVNRNLNLLVFFFTNNFSRKLSKGFYICSLSSKTITYKGQLAPRQVYDYFHDLNHVLYCSHFALVHSRFSTNTFPSWDRAQPLRMAAHNGQFFVATSLQQCRNFCV
jgi:glutamate synthase (NADH)